MRVVLTLPLLPVVSLSMFAQAPASPERPWINTVLSPEQRAALLVKAMTLDEKSAQSTHANSNRIRASPSPSGPRRVLSSTRFAGVAQRFASVLHPCSLDSAASHTWSRLDDHRLPPSGPCVPDEAFDPPPLPDVGQRAEFQDRIEQFKINFQVLGRIVQQEQTTEIQAGQHLPDERDGCENVTGHRQPGSRGLPSFHRRR